MEEYFTVTVTHFELYNQEKAELDWIEWCWQYIGKDNFSWTLDPISSDRDYVYHIRFKNEGDKVLFILNWL